MSEAPVQASSDSSPQTEELDAVIVGAGFAGLYMLHRLRGLGLGARVRGAATASAAPGTGTATRARAATSRAWSTRTSSPTSSSRSGSGASATRPSPRSCATRTTSPTGSTCAATSCSRRASTSRRFDEDAARWAVDDRSGERFSARFLHHGDGLPVVANVPDFPASTTSRAIYHTGDGRTRASTSPASAWRDRHRLVGDPVDPGDRRAGRASHGLPAHAELLACRRTTRRSTPGSEAAIKARYAELRARQARRSAACFGADLPNARPRRSTMRRRAARRLRGALGMGGLAFLGAFADLLT